MGPKAQRERVDAIRERLRKVREYEGKLPTGVRRPEGLRDADEAAVAQVNLDALDADHEYLMQLENTALSQIGSGSSCGRW